MIAPECFQSQWIQEHKGRLGVRDASLLERCICALDLVARLRRAGLEFIFKGGTSLVLHLQPLRRLSIDVDIACGATLEEITRALSVVVYAAGPFKRFEHQFHRDRDEPPTKHFKVLFNSAVRPGHESHILLDVLFEPSIYPDTVEMDLSADFIRTSDATPIRVPTVDCLLGDKLAAFAPSTIGVLYEPPVNRAGDPIEPQQTRVAKQLYDVAELFSVAHSLDMVRRTYETILPVQNAYRKRNYSLSDTLLDTIEAAYWFSQRDLKYGEAHANSDFLQKGVANLDSHLVGNGLSVPAAKAAAARAACLAAMLLGNSQESLADIRADAGTAADQSGDPLTGKYERLRALRKTAPEAFYYWLQVVRYLGV